ncbi:MAG: hypothetical protein Q4C67_01670, partial [Deinococcus sp.]|nr:hypothetical protein [Deinococcus sp.]
GQLRLIAAEAQQGRLHPWALLWLAEGLTLAALLLCLLPRRVAADLADPAERLGKPGLRHWNSPLPAQHPGRDPLAWVLPGSGLLDRVWGGLLLLAFVTAAVAWTAGRALPAGADLPWPRALWPAAGWPRSLPGLSGSWPLAVMALAWAVNAAWLWTLGRRQPAGPSPSA